MKTHISVSELTRNVTGLIDAIDALIQKADDDLADTLKAQGYVNPDEAVDMINLLEDEWTDALNGECDDLLAALDSASSVDNFMETVWPSIKSSENLRDAIYDVFHERFKGMLEMSVVGWLNGDDPDLLTDGMEILSQPAKDFVESWSSDLADLMNLSTKDQIERILINGQKEHLSVAQVAQDIADSGIREPGYKARRAAITEVLRAESYGQLEAMLQNPAVSEKEWEHTGGYRVQPRENHQAINGQRVSVNEPFTLVGADGVTYNPMCPRDTNLPAGETINCHCLMKQIRDPNWSSLTIEEKRALREQRLEELNDV